LISLATWTTGEEGGEGCGVVAADPTLTYPLRSELRRRFVSLALPESKSPRLSFFRESGDRGESTFEREQEQEQGELMGRGGMKGRME